MEQPEKYNWLDEYLESLEKSLGFMDLSTLQPTSWRHFQPLVSQEWLIWFWRIIDEREKKDVSFTRIAENFEPDLCREHLLFTLEDLKSAHWPKEKRLKVADFFYQTLKAQMPQGDLFGLHGSTKRHSKDEVNKIIRGPFELGTPQTARELGKLYNGAYNLGAALYLDFYMGKAVENWGSYELPGERTLVIKEMRYLKPVEIWPNIKTLANKIDLYAVYEGVKFSTDLIACHTQYEGDAINGLKAWRLVVDGRKVRNIEEIQTIAKNFAEIGSEQWQKLVNTPEEKLLEKTVWIRCFCFNEVCKVLRLDWRPPQNLIDAVRGKTLTQGWETWKQPKEERLFKEYWRKMWDPREEFYP